MTGNRPISKQRMSIVVVGSTNTDMVIKTSHLPAAGETIIGGNFFMGGGSRCAAVLSLLTKHQYVLRSL